MPASDYEDDRCNYLDYKSERKISILEDASNNLHCRRVRVSNKGLLLQSRKVTRWQLAK